ncbi:MAG: hypothetical protein KC548_01490 [Nanoarchaeota archaeon]|nr:hypothetical protein [Nanoarchaeota archaeon]
MDENFFYLRPSLEIRPSSERIDPLQQKDCLTPHIVREYEQLLSQRSPSLETFSVVYVKNPSLQEDGKLKGTFVEGPPLWRRATEEALRKKTLSYGQVDFFGIDAFVVVLCELSNKPPFLFSQLQTNEKGELNTSITYAQGSVSLGLSDWSFSKAFTSLLKEKAYDENTTQLLLPKETRILSPDYCISTSSALSFGLVRKITSQEDFENLLTASLWGEAFRQTSFSFLSLGGENNFFLLKNGRGTSRRQSFQLTDYPLSSIEAKIFENLRQNF